MPGLPPHLHLTNLARNPSRSSNLSLGIIQQTRKNTITVSYYVPSESDNALWKEGGTEGRKDGRKKQGGEM